MSTLCLVLCLVAVAMPESAAQARQAATVWQWPLDAPRMLRRGYIAPSTPFGAGHRGIDIGSSAAVGGEIAVYAPADGIVHFAGVVVNRPVLSIRHAGGLISSFEPVTTTLVAGDIIHRGQVVAQLEAGHCRAPCLHFGVRRHGEYVSPLNYLGGIPHSVLLPTRPLPD